MTFLRVSDPAAASPLLLERLRRELAASKTVLWLVSGGSNIAISVAVMQQLEEALTSRLIIALTDERFGAVGHADSNAAQLLQAGFDAKQAVFIPVLQGGLLLEETAQAYGKAYSDAVHRSDVVIAQFGIGDDGHIAGILPNSPAVTSADTTSAYSTATYTRITLTPKALGSVTTAYAFVFGASKAEALRRLESQEIPLAEQPSQLLKQLPEVFVCNDQIGDPI